MTLKNHFSNIKQDFPILTTQVYGRNPIYFDNAATTQKPKIVIDSICDYYRQYNANIHRGIYKFSEQATEKYENARKKIANFINANPDEIIFVRGTTEGINLIAYSWGRNNLLKNDLIVSSVMEHHSNIVPWQLLSQDIKSKLEFIGVNKNYSLSLTDFEKLLNKNPKLVTITHMSNFLGTINPIEDIIKKAHSYGAKVLVDAAQSVPQMPIDVKKIDCDFLTFSGHKMLGPTGIGILYAKKEILENMPPFHGGGDMIKEVRLEASKWNDVPWKFEAGTTNIAGAIGLGVAVDYLENIGMTHVQEHEKRLLKYALDKMSALKYIDMYGVSDLKFRGGVVSFNLQNLHPHDVATVLDKYSIAIRAGHHCAQPLHEYFNLSASNRASFYIYNTESEVDAFVDALDKVKDMFKL